MSFLSDSMMTKQLKKNNLHSLKSKKAFNSLFDKGVFYKEKNVGFRYCKGKKIGFYLGYTVSKKQFTRAVDRNLIKRRLRSEVYKISEFFLNSCPPGTYLFYYLGKKIPLSVDLSISIKGVVKKFTQET